MSGKYDLEFTREFLRKAKFLESDPHSGKPLKGGLTGLYSLRQGDYRIIYGISKGIDHHRRSPELRIRMSQDTISVY